jgi:hypothetical protein
MLRELLSASEGKGSSDTMRFALISNSREKSQSVSKGDIGQKDPVVRLLYAGIGKQFRERILHSHWIPGWPDDDSVEQGGDGNPREPFFGNVFQGDFVDRLWYTCNNLYLLGHVIGVFPPRKVNDPPFEFFCESGVFGADCSECEHPENSRFYFLPGSLSNEISVVLDVVDYSPNFSSNFSGSK